VNGVPVGLVALDLVGHLREHLLLKLLCLTAMVCARESRGSAMNEPDESVIESLFLEDSELAESIIGHV